MYDCTRNYIGGVWAASSGTLHDIINPATEQPIGQVAFGTAGDVDRAVSAARTTQSAATRVRGQSTLLQGSESAAKVRCPRSCVVIGASRFGSVTDIPKT